MYLSVLDFNRLGIEQFLQFMKCKFVCHMFFSVKKIMSRLNISAHLGGGDWPCLSDRVIDPFLHMARQLIGPPGGRLQTDQVWSLSSFKVSRQLLTRVWKRIGVNSEFHIPIPILLNWFLECPNSNSSSGIVASTPILTQWNWGDSTGIPISKFPTLCSPLKRRKS